MRAFLSVDLSDQNTVQKIVDLQREMLTAGADIKTVDANNLHFTIKFFGEINDYVYSNIKDLFINIDVPQIKIKYQSLGAFPSDKNPRIIWIGVDDTGAETLSKLSNEVVKRLGALNIGDSKPFHPHLTIARVKSGKNRGKLQEFIKSFKNKAFGEDFIDSLKLKKSDLTRNGPVYTEVNRYSLKTEGEIR